MKNMTKNIKEKKSNAIWNLFSSIKLTVALLIILAFLSIIGTIIPQQGPAAIEFARGLSPGTFKLFNSLGLFDMYHSFWFRIVMAALALNLVVCSIERFPATWKRFRAQPGLERSKPFENIPEEQTFLTKTSLSQVAEKTSKTMSSHLKKTRSSKTGEKFFFYGEKGRFSYFGVYFVHLSVILILIGGLIGSRLGLEAFLNIPEGGKVNIKEIFVRKGSIPRDFDFDVVCEKFFMEFYESGAPKEFRSDLRFIVNGKEIKKASVRVNHPVVFKGITFYQSSYDSIPDKNVRLKITQNSNRPEETFFDAEVGREIELPGKEGKFRVLDISGNLRGVMGPAALISIVPEKSEEIRFWVFLKPDILKKRFPPEMLKSPALNPSAFKPYTFFMTGMKMRNLTKLQVNMDPGVPVVWVGFVGMILGFMVTFFTSHRRIWVRISKDGDMVRISAAGTANKNLIGLNREIGRLITDLKDQFK
ncbi:cytochrome c biogenesis protein ResB [Thermodesulfobacteriota bacterium]